jgi:hypothetical protein
VEYRSKSRHTRSIKLRWVYEEIAGEKLYFPIVPSQAAGELLNIIFFIKMIEVHGELLQLSSCLTGRSRTEVVSEFSGLNLEMVIE